MRRSDYLRLSASKPFLKCRNFILIVEANDMGLPRLGITASRKVGPSVVRNRIKRIFREAFRHCIGMLPSVDLHIIARASAKEAPAKLLQDEFCVALRKIG